MSFDNRGTNSPRGRDWRKCIYRQVGVLRPPKDQAEAVRKVLSERPYLDPERVGVWGWSGGGSMTLNAMLKFPEVYSTGMAVAPVPDQRLYDTIYQERYMGLPSDNVEGYLEGSPINFAASVGGQSPPRSRHRRRQLPLSGHRGADERIDPKQETLYP